MTVIGHLINGEIVGGATSTQDVFNPSTGEVSKQVAMASRDTVEAAITAAQNAFPAWRSMPPAKRARIMLKARDLLEKNTGIIAEIIGVEHGKIAHDAIGEIQRGIENVEYASYATELLKGEHSRNAGPQIDSWSEFHPLGVVAGITPFNFPAMVPLWMYPLAIVCGNCFILKPSERDPSAALFIASLFHEAGLPDGVLNVVNGGREAVDALLADPRVKAVSFVGSTPVAQHIHATASANGKRCQALGGAKNHAIVMPDADMDNSVNALTGAAFGSSGERCMAISVAVAVGEQTAEALTGKMRERMAELKCGVWKENSNDFGPLITAEHLDRVEAFIASAEEEGAEIAVDGRGLKVKGYEGGFFTGGTLIDHVKPHMKCYTEEIFGPVLCVVRVKTMSEAMDLVNGHEYGNGACIFTRDGEAARYFSDNVEAGMAGINVPLPVPVSYHSFGGWKRSLFGDLCAYGPDGVRFYTRRKTITQRWPSAGVRESVDFSFPGSE